MLAIVASVLHLGNISFQQGDMDNAELLDQKSEDAMFIVSHLMQVSCRLPTLPGLLPSLCSESLLFASVAVAIAIDLSAALLSSAPLGRLCATQNSSSQRSGMCIQPCYCS